MSRSGGVEAHSHVGEGHVCVVGIVGGLVGLGVEWLGIDVVLCQTGREVENVLSCRIHGTEAREKRAKAIDMFARYET